MPDTASAPIRLPPGRHGLPRHFVVHSQRERVLRAVAEAAAQEGYAALTLTEIVRRAGVSRRTFYELFEDKDAALLAAYDAAAEQLVNVLLDALAGPGDELARMRAAADSLLAFFAAEPAFSRMAFVEAPLASPAVRAHHRRTVAAFEASVDALRSGGSGAPPACTTRVLIAGVHQLIVDAVLEDRIEELPALRPSIMYLLVLPWFGADAARRELDAGAQPASGSAASSRATASEA